MSYKMNFIGSGCFAVILVFVKTDGVKCYSVSFAFFSMMA
jgi:hypothetical protein